MSDLIQRLHNVKTYFINKGWPEMADDLQEMAEEAESQQQELTNLRERISEEKTCEWWLDDEEDNIWVTDCGRAYVLNEGNPEDNEVIFCNFCGGKLNKQGGE